MTIEHTLMEPEVTYEKANRDAYYFINMARQGINYSNFSTIANQSLFNLNEWSEFLHLSERTMQRYKKEDAIFDVIHSERIIQLTLLFKFGIDVFGTKEKFNIWIESKSIALGNVIPKDLLDNSFGIDLIRKELGRIEHGILA